MNLTWKKVFSNKEKATVHKISIYCQSRKVFVVANCYRVMKFDSLRRNQLVTVIKSRWMLVHLKILYRQCSAPSILLLKIWLHFNSSDMICHLNYLLFFERHFAYIFSRLNSEIVFQIPLLTGGKADKSKTICHLNKLFSDPRLLAKIAPS